MSSRKRDYKYCQHCQRELNVKRFKEHERLYYNKDTKEWLKETVEVSDQESEFSCFDGLEGLDVLEDNEDRQGNCEMEDWNLSDPDDDDQDGSGDEASDRCFHLVKHNEDIEYWLENDDEIDDDVRESVSSLPPNDLQFDTDKNNDAKVITKWIVLLVSLFKSRFVISDSAISWLLKFLVALLMLLGTFSKNILTIARAIPCSLFQYKKLLQTDSFRKYNVCKKCDSLYTHQECKQLGICPYKALPRSKRCGEPLLKHIVSASGHNRLYPHKIFCISDLVSGLQNLLLRDNFIELCESTRSLSTEFYSDVFDGSIWKEFQEVDGKAFLSSSNNYGLLLNVDWLQPFEHTTYSVGVIFLVVLNLPRSVRFKRENVLLYGVIPGPSEPSLTINTYLSPLISDLLDLWKGVELSVPGSCTKKTFRCALLGVSCDLPAARKTCGFLSHSATLGCSKCYHKFFDGSNKADYGGDFERGNWEVRTNSRHRSDVEDIKKCSTKTGKARAELEKGCRYSVLLDLPYFDPVKMLLIDPMHNLFLGTAKHFMFNVLIGKQILDTSKLNKIRNRLRCAVVPPGLGRLPNSVDLSTFLTAEQWKNWTVYFSIYCFYDLLPNNQLECWRHFVLACCRLCKRCASNNDLIVADALILRFCKRFKEIYGTDALTPNMHMNCHLVSCIRDFGPIQSFWLFPFERYNGILGSQPNNNRSVEIQLIQRFHEDNSNQQLVQEAKSLPFYEHFEEFVKETNSQENSNGRVSMGSKFVLSTLSCNFITVLRNLYAKLYPEFSESICNGTISVPSIFRKYASITKNNMHINSMLKKTAVNTYVLASPIFPFTSSNPSEFEGNLRPVKLHYFMEHHIQLPEKTNPNTHVFACVSWPTVHPDRFIMGKPVEIWCNDLYEPDSANSFIPVSSISKRVIYSTEEIKEETVLIIIPIIE